MTIQLHLPYPPSANNLWTRTKRGMRRTDEYMAWLVDAGWTAKAQHPGKLTGPYKLSIHAARPDKRRRDIDNLIKPTGDLLQSIGVIEDDCDCEMVCARWVTSSGGGLIVYIDRAGTEDVI